MALFVQRSVQFAPEQQEENKSSIIVVGPFVLSR